MKHHMMITVDPDLYDEMKAKEENMSALINTLISEHYAKRVTIRSPEEIKEDFEVRKKRVELQEEQEEKLAIFQKRIKKRFKEMDKDFDKIEAEQDTKESKKLLGDENEE